MTPASTRPPDDTPLPALRPELKLLPGTPDATGRPTWLIHDALLNRFVEIDRAAFEAFRHWRSSNTSAELAQRINAAGRLQTNAAAVAALVDFVYAHQLTDAPRAGGWRSFVATNRANRHSLLAALVHNYLFFRIPLVQPQKFLERTLPFVRRLWSQPSRLTVLAMGLVGLHLASRQWDHFVNTLLTYLSWEGVASGAIALGMVKIAHELGHAYAAASLGCRVHSMGLAFVVMAPMPYTDVTDAWRLTDRRKRLLIDSAGMVAEAAIAAVALIAWAFLPDGPLRSAAFVLSVVSIASSLAINLNPFMRFDGYYLLSEALGVANLQSRAFAIGRWQLREWLFGLGDPAPEEMPTHRRTWLALYAWTTWIYRLFLFLGIALLVYHYFFKALGLILFAVEIVYFIARPIGGELSAWWQMRSRLWTSPRARLTCAATMIAVLLGCIPLSTTVEIPAVLEFTRLQSIYPTRNAQVVAVHVRHGQAVRAGAPIATLASAEIVDERTRAQISLQIAELQFGRRLADAADREGSLIIESRIEAARTQIAGLDREQSELEIVAPFDGRIAELNPEIHPGRWVSPRDLIAIVTDGRSLSAKGYVAEADVGRIRPGARARFIPEHPGRERVELEIERISQAGVAQIEIADLASINSGRVAVSLDDRRRLIPASAQYMVSMITTEVSTNGDLAIRGLVHAEGRPESVFARVWRRALGVLVRESGA